MFDAIKKRNWVGALLAVAVTSGCAAAETDDAPLTRESQQALTKKDVLVDVDGRKWKNNGKVTYEKKRYADLTREVAATSRMDSSTLSAAKLDTMTDAEALQVIRPRMEFGNTEFVMEEEDARELVSVFRELKKERLARSARGITRGEDGSRPGQTAAEDDLGGVSQGLIINGDQRANNNHRADEYPYNMIAQGGTASDPWCTCFKMINDHTCITAGHCHWWKGKWQARRPITFQAGSTAPRKQIPADCYTRTTWYSGGDDKSWDVAVIALRGRGNAWCDPKSYNGGWFGWHEPVEYPNQMDTWTAGYPSEPPNGWRYPTQTHQSSALTTRAEIGWYLAYTHDMTGGQSGSPVVTTWSSGGYRVRGSHWGAPSSDANRNYGMTMWEEVVDRLSGEAGY